MSRHTFPEVLCDKQNGRSFSCPAVASFVLAIALSGCWSLAPHYERPPMPVSDAWPSDAPASGVSSVGRISWRDYFPDVQLQALIEQALVNNRDLRMAVQRVEEARATYGIQRADQFPTIDAAAAYARYRAPGGFLTVPLVGSSPSVEGSLYNVSLIESNWELDLWGRVRNLKTAALEEYLATDATRRAVIVSLIAQVADSYLVLREYDERIALARDTVASRTESLRIFRRRFETGAAARLDLTQSEILLQQAQTLDAQLERSRATEAHALDLLVGEPVHLSPAAAPLNDASVRSDLGAGLPSELLANRPDIAAAEHQLRAANANIGLARAAFFPRIALTSSYGTSSTELHRLFASGTAAWLFLPNLSLPIFDAGRNRSNLQLAHARENEAVAHYESTIQGAFRDVADALSAREWLAQQVQIARETLDSQTERARLVKLRYDRGATPFLELLDAQRDLLTAQQQLVQTRRALLSSRVALFAALGGGVSSGATAGSMSSSSEHSMQEGSPP
ncbi:RND transporter [Burkholderia ubonensis]|uniref:efflux transporter outer membrane subunit n=1 Tax=Burkholderia ubonensis TaxID=101571 RepID=UPI00075C87BC|nr:efflux transporter outer membrane subunit [Burkholderia ubonensis]KUZ67607.1 RND transporter [Burkholderia ubonensis]KVA16977.1 RND transporter [Burkholderia ubonensis]KVA17405.1 RND transporter [Burkholderia ubonensis]KVA34523.1 RND transporter [Burkholderia ubonensis]